MSDKKTNNTAFSSVGQGDLHIHNGLDMPQIPFASIKDYTVSADGTMAADSKNILPTQSAVVTYVAAQLASASLGLFGDGSDGPITSSSGTTTLTRDTFYTNVILSGSAVIQIAGYRVFATGTINISGSASIQNNGGAGGNGGVSPGITGGTGGTAGAATPIGSLSGSVSGVAGTVGGSGSSTGGGAGVAASVNGGNVTHSISAQQTGTSGNGGNGGNGTAGTGGQGGSTSGITNGTWSAALTYPRTLVYAYNNFDAGSTTYALLSTSNGSFGATGGGAGGGAGGSANGGGGGGGGGSGAAGGIVAVFANTITNSATGGIQAIGGKGGNGANGVNSSGTNTGGGGGGGAGQGGAGGAIILVYQTLNQTGTFSVAGGVAGTPGTGALGNGAGLPGANGSTASAGATGSIYVVQVL